MSQKKSSTIHSGCQYYYYYYDFARIEMEFVAETWL